MTNKLQDIAKKYFYEKKYKNALNLFIKEKNYFGAGLTSLLLKNQQDAFKYWNLNKNCKGCQFGLYTLDYINLKTPKIPTFFQTRAFLEIFLNLFLEDKLFEWAQNFINCYETFYRGNPESYKFIARALFANGYCELSSTFCKKSLDIFYTDPEALLILAQNCYILKNYEEAKYYNDRILKLTPEYYPAKLFNNILEQVLRSDT